MLVSLVSLIILGNRFPVHVLGRKPGTNVFRARSAEHPEDETFPGLLLLRPEGAIYFGNVSRVARLIQGLRSSAAPRVVVLDLAAVPDLEYTALRMLVEAEENMRNDRVALWLVALNSEVLRVVQHSGLGDRLGRERMFFTLEQAVKSYESGTPQSSAPAKG